MFSSGFIRLALLHYGLNKERCSALGLAETFLELDFIACHRPTPSARSIVLVLYHNSYG